MKLAWLAILSFALLVAVLTACSSGSREGQTLESLPEAERAALDAICKAAGTEPAKLRDVGIGADFRDARNQQAIAIRNGHVHTLALAKTTFTEPPDFSKLTDLEALWLEDGALKQWPDLSKLSKLNGLHLNGQPLGTPHPSLLPKQLEIIDLAGTQIADLNAFTGFFSLRKLDVSGSKVESIAPIMGLQINQLNLARTPIKSLPRQMPASGHWELDLDETALTQIPGFSRKKPSHHFYTSKPLDGVTMTGTAKSENVDVQGSIAQLEQSRPVHLPSDQREEEDSGFVSIEATVAGGRVRVWLVEPRELFAEPWFQAGKVKDWSRYRPKGSISVEVAPGQPGKLRGELWREGMEPSFIYYFMVEPLDSKPAAGLQFQIKSSK